MVVVEEVGIGCVARLAKDDKDCQAIGFRYAAGLFVKPLALFSNFDYHCAGDSAGDGQIRGGFLLVHFMG